MADYVESTLVNGEKIMCRAHYHWFWWLKRILACAVVIAVGAICENLGDGGGAITAFAILVALVSLIYSYLRYTYDEIVITNHRVVLKTRILARDVFEMQIQKVETILVTQSVMGRVFDFGAIACKGTGGTTSRTVEIADPLAFRAAFQNAVKESQSTQPAYVQPAPAVSYAAPETAEPKPETPSLLAAAPAEVKAAALDNAKLDEIISLLKEISTKLGQH